MDGTRYVIGLRVAPDEREKPMLAVLASFARPVRVAATVSVTKAPVRAAKDPVHARRAGGLCFTRTQIL